MTFDSLKGLAAAPSRSEFMRQDLGPIVTHLTRRAYDEALEHWQPPERFVIGDVNIIDVPAIALSQLDAIDALLRRGRLHDDVLAYPANRIPLVQVRRHTEYGVNETRATHFGGLWDIMREGLHSGIVMPWALYTAGQISREGSFSVTGPLDLPSARSDMQQPDFRASLAQMAHTKNGILGAQSSAASGTAPCSGPNAVYREAKCPFENPAVDYTLSKSTKYYLAGALRELNRGLPEQQANSVGCPLRYANFPTLGPLAQSYAQEHGLPAETLRTPGSSGIILGTQFVIACIDRLIDARESSKQL